MIDELNKLKDEELEAIVIRGDNLNIPNSQASTAKRILDSRRQKSLQQAMAPLTDLAQVMAKINTSFTIPNLASANATISAVANITESLNAIPKMYAEAIKVPTIGTAPLFSAIKNVQEIAGTAVWRDIANNTVSSPILNVVNEIQDVKVPTFPAKIIEGPREVIPAKLAEEISSATSQKADTIFNFPAYKYFFQLERSLRDFIQKNIVEPNLKQLDTKIPKEMIEEWERKKKAEEENVHPEHVDYELIEYSDFTDLKRILEKRTTAPLIKDLINEENLKTITSKLHELEPVRLKIAHSRAVTEKEFETLRVYAENIEKVLPAQ